MSCVADLHTVFIRSGSCLDYTAVCHVQAQHNRAASWGSLGSASDLPGLSASPAPSGALPPSVTASGQLPEGVPASRLLSTIHSGIPSTDDDGVQNPNLFAVHRHLFVQGVPSLLYRINSHRIAVL